MYAPSQVALAAIIHATSKQGHNLDAYVTKVLLGHEEGQENLTNLIEAVRSKNSSKVGAQCLFEKLSRGLKVCSKKLQKLSVD
jgi:cyclin H